MSVRVFALVAPLVGLLGLVRCEAPQAPPPAHASVNKSPAATEEPVPSKEPAKLTAPKAVDPDTRFAAAKRVVAIGDVHGDLAATRKALRLAGAIDESDQWVGGDLVLVQTGDQLDRGDDERAILELFEKVRDQAAAAGGTFHILNGNHEVMNVQADLRYVTPGGFEDFAAMEGLDTSAPELAEVPENMRARVAAFIPGGHYARLMANRNTVVIVGETVFVHGGVLPEHIEYGLDRLNAETRRWMRGELDQPPALVAGERGLVWVRDFSADPVDDDECQVLSQTLGKLGVERMVVAHTVQPGGIRPACDGKVWRIDVGMAAHYGGKPAVLEIVGDDVRAITE